MFHTAALYCIACVNGHSVKTGAKLSSFVHKLMHYLNASKQYYIIHVYSVLAVNLLSASSIIFLSYIIMAVENGVP